MQKQPHWTSLVHMFFAKAEKHENQAFLYAKKEGSYKSQSWQEAANDIRALAAGLKDIGVKAGDRVMLVSENRPEWAIADLAIMSIGAIAVPAYTTNTTSDHQHIVDDSGAKAAIVSTRALASRLLPAAHEADKLQSVITMEDPRISQHLNCEIYQWQDLIDEHREAALKAPLDLGHLKRDDVCCLIYTSGTGGAPKGVMLSHGAILHNCAGAFDVVQELGLAKERFLCFLPLSHAYEHTGGLFLPIFLDSEIYYAESLDKLAANIQEVQPTIMTIVPRMFEMLRQRITRQVEQQGGLTAKLFEETLTLGKKALLEPENLTLGEKLRNKALDVLVRRKVIGRFGGKTKALVSGGAPLNRDVGLFFLALGLRVLQGYGQTESAPVISVNRPSNAKIDTVGPPLPDTEVRIAEDGEILVRGELVMKGYWNDEEATNRAIKDGWLHTGDIGVLDKDGHLKITDRKKDIIVNDKGDNISPQRIEGMLTLEPEIAQAMVYGDDRPYLVGLLVPDQDWLDRWARKQGKEPDLKLLARERDLHKALDEAVSRVNKRLSNLEKVRRFILAEEPFSIDNSMFTPTMKIRRHVICDHYGKQMEALYQTRG